MDTSFKAHELDFKAPSFVRRCALGVVGFGVRARSIWKFPIECLPVFDAAAQKLRPCRYSDILWK